jgi:hypothetical protein
MEVAHPDAAMVVLRARNHLADTVSPAVTVGPRFERSSP